MTARFHGLPSSYIVAPHDLQEALSAQSDNDTNTQMPRVVALSAAWFLPNAAQTGHQSFLSKRIPGSLFFDLDTIKHPDSPYPHMLPTPAGFAEAMNKLGILRDDAVVLYDSPEQGLFSAPRAAWTFRQFKHPRVHVLDNFKEWVRLDLPVEEGGMPIESIPARDGQQYEIPPEAENARSWVGFSDVKSWADRQIDGPRRDEGEAILIDARPAGRFTGEAPEPREGLSSGHIPGSTSVPFSDLLDPQSKTLLSKDDLVKIFKKKGVTEKNAADGPGLKIISACGTGVTAAVVDLALEKAGWAEGDRGIYDGSWTEWASRMANDEGYIVKGKE